MIRALSAAIAATAITVGVLGGALAAAVWIGVDQPMAEAFEELGW